MRKSLLLLLLLIFVVVFGLEFMETASRKELFFTERFEPIVARVRKPKFPDRVGEKVIYDVLLGNMRVGQAVFHYQAKAELNLKPANLYSFETRMVRFKDKEKIYCDPDTFFPLRVEREISVWPKYERIIEVYDQDNFTLNIVKTESNRNSEQNFKKDSPIHNAIMLPYLVRQLPELAVGWSFQANLPTQQFKIELIDMAEIKVAAGTFKTYHFKSTPNRFEIWVSADENKIPLKIKGMSGIGYTLVMREYVFADKT